MAYSFPEYQDVLTFGRTTHDTVLDSDGQLKTILNRLNPSTDLTDTDEWTHTGLDSVVASGTSPSGKTAYLLTENSASGGHRLYDQASFTAGQYYKFSVDFKSNGRDLLLLLPSGAFGAALYWHFDPNAVTATQELGGTLDAGFISDLGDGWYRADLYAKATASGTSSFMAYASDGAAASYTGDGSSGVYLSRVRVMKASVHAPVERCTAAWAVPSGYDNTLSSVTASSFTATEVTSDLRTYLVLPTVAGETYRVGGAATVTSTFYARDGNNPSSGTIIASSAGTDEVFTFTALSSQTVFLIATTAAASPGTVDYSGLTFTKVITDGMQLGSDGEDFVDGAGPIYVDGRAYDGNGAALGKQCFEGRTNLVADSNDLSIWSFVGASLDINAAVSPSGDLDAQFLKEDTSTGQHYALKNYAMTAVDHVFYGLFKAGGRDWLRLYTEGATNDNSWINVSTGVAGKVDPQHTVTIKDWGDGWYLVGVTFLGAAASKSVAIALADADNSSSYTGDGSSGIYFTEINLQAGSTVGPPIPTNGSAVARGADSTYKLLNEFGFRQDQYTVLAEFQSAGSDGGDYPFIFDISDGTSTNHSYVLLNTSNNVSQTVVDGGAVQVNQYPITGYTPDTEVKIATAFKQDDFAVSGDGDAALTDTTGSMPPVSRISLGTKNGSYHLNGYLKRLVIYPARLTDATLVEQSS